MKRREIEKIEPVGREKSKGEEAQKTYPVLMGVPGKAFPFPQDAEERGGSIRHAKNHPGGEGNWKGKEEEGEEECYGSGDVAEINGIAAHIPGDG